MFERFTEQARRVLFFSRYETSQVGGLSIETEHMLLGIIRDGRGIASRILATPPSSLEALRQAIERRTTAREKIATSVEIPFSMETKMALQYATEEADRFHHSYIGAEHLLLGLLRVEGSQAAAVLGEHGLRLEAVRAEIASILEESPALGAPPQRAEIMERLHALVDHLERAPEHLRSEIAATIHRELDALERGPDP